MTDAEWEALRAAIAAGGCLLIVLDTLYLILEKL